MTSTTEIISALDQHPYIGTHVCDFCVERPVVTLGESRLWTITRQDDGTYTFALDGWVAIPNDDRNAVVVRLNGTQSWEVAFLNDNPMTFRVNLPGAPHFWTLAGVNPDTQVELKPYNPDDQGQEFAAPIHED